MKILVLLSHTPNPRAMKRIKLLNEKGADLFLICARRKLNLNFFYTLPEGVKSKEIAYNDTNFFMRLFSLVNFMLVAVRNIKCFKPEIIHLTNLDMLLCAVLYKKFLAKQVKIIYEVADIPEMLITRKENFLTKQIKRVEAQLCQNIYKLILTSPRYYDAYYCRFVNREKMFFMPNAPSKKVFMNYTRKIDKEKFVVGFIGFIRYLEALEILVDAVKILPNVELLIVGDGVDTESLKAYVKQVQATNVTFIGKYDYEKEIVSLYAQIDMVYSAYDNTSNNSKIALPNRLYEAIVCELPIIVSEGTYLSEVVNELQVGVTVDPFDAKDINHKIAEISQMETYESISSQCRKIKDSYYLEQYNAELIKLYKIEE